VHRGIDPRAAPSAASRLFDVEIFRANNRDGAVVCIWKFDSYEISIEESTEDICQQRRQQKLLKLKTTANDDEFFR
jgi:hypothetical protein